MLLLQLPTLAPSEACAGSSTSVIITGTSFTGTTSVSFNGTSASFTVDSPTQITATLPSSATTGTISVTTPYGSDASSSSFTVNAVPTITGTTPGSRNGSGTVVLGANSSTGTINWYDSPTGGSSLGTGTSFTTPYLTATTSYYVDAINNGCTTASRTEVVATIVQDPNCPVVSGQNTIYGNIYEDIDGDGVFDATESNYTTTSISLNLYEDANDNGLLDDGAPALLTTTSDGSGNYSFDITPAIATTTETVRDEFTSQSYSANYGTQNWSGDWIETDPFGVAGPVGNYVGITAGRLFFHYSYAYEERISRSADLSSASSATLTLDWETVGLDFGEELSIQISDDGINFTTIGIMSGNMSSSFSYDISSYISSNTTIRFYNEGGN